MGRNAINAVILALLVGWYIWPSMQYLAANTQLTDYRYREAITNYNKAINSNRLFDMWLHRAYFGRAEAHLGFAIQTRSGDRDIILALDDYSKAVNLNSDTPIYFRNRGTAYTLVGAYDEAFADFETLQILEGDLPMWSLVRKGGLLRQLGRYEEAHQAFQTVLDIWDRPLMPPYYHMALTYKEQGQHHLVIKAIDEGMKAQSNYGIAFKERAVPK